MSYPSGGTAQGAERKGPRSLRPHVSCGGVGTCSLLHPPWGPSLPLQLLSRRLSGLRAQPPPSACSAQAQHLAVRLADPLLHDHACDNSSDLQAASSREDLSCCSGQALKAIAHLGLHATNHSYLLLLACKGVARAGELPGGLYSIAIPPRMLPSWPPQLQATFPTTSRPHWQERADDPRILRQHLQRCLPHYAVVLQLAAV